MHDELNNRDVTYNTDHLTNNIKKKDNLLEMSS